MDFDHDLFDMDIDLPADLPVLSVDDFFDDYLIALGSASQPSSSQDSANLLAPAAGPLWEVSAPQESGGSGGHVQGATSDLQQLSNGRSSPTYLQTAGPGGSPGAHSNAQSGGNGTHQYYGSGGGNGYSDSQSPARAQALLETGRNPEAGSDSSLPPIVQLPPPVGSYPGTSTCLSPMASLDIPLPEMGLLPQIDTFGHLSQPNSLQDLEQHAAATAASRRQAGQLAPFLAYDSSLEQPSQMTAQPSTLPAPFTKQLPTRHSPEGSTQPGLRAEARAGPASSGVTGTATPQPGEEEDEYTDGEEDDEGGQSGAVGSDGKPKKPRRRRNRTERQQMLNKLAQQRYRERKKQKALDTERAAQALATKMEEYNMVQQKHRLLNEQNRTLQRRLAEKEAQLATIHAEAAITPVQGSTPTEGLGPAPEEVERLAFALHDKIFALREHLRRCGLEHPQQEVHQLPPETTRKLESLVEEVSTLSMRAQHAEGVDVWRMVNCTAPNNSCAPGCTCPLCRRKEAWVDVVVALGLSPEQHRKFVHIRNEYARKLEAIYQQRQRLNLEAVSVMLPQDRGGSAPEMLSGQVASYVFLGFYQRARHSAKMNTVLDLLKENLRAEQRASSEVDYITFRRILTPVQGAWLILESYPLKCDSLALSNAVLQLYGQPQAPPHAARWQPQTAFQGVGGMRQGGSSQQANLNGAPQPGSDLPDNAWSCGPAALALSNGQPPSFPSIGRESIMQRHGFDPCGALMGNSNDTLDAFLLHLQSGEPSFDSGHSDVPTSRH